MTARYTVYLEVEYDSTNEGNYKKRFYSVDCNVSDLAFLAQLPNAERFGNQDEVLQVAVHHGSSIAQTPVDQHFESLEELITHFGSIHFKKDKK